MRTRMYGGVRGRGFAAPFYSISINFSKLLAIRLLHECASPCILCIKIYTVSTVNVAYAHLRKWNNFNLTDKS